MSDINKNMHKFQKFQNTKTISLEKTNIPINKNNNGNQFKLTLHSGLDGFLSQKHRYFSVTLHLLEKITRYVTVTKKLELVLE